MSHPFEAKHVIVAACAAIAMVLGAMSVGASISSPNDQPATKAEVSSIVDSRPTTNKPSTSVSGTGLSSQHTLEVRNFLQQQSSPLYTVPAPSKAIRNSLSPIFGTSDPIRFMDQMVQLQQQTQPPDPTKDSTAVKDPTAPTDGSTSTDTTKPAAGTTPTGESSKPTDSTTPADGSAPTSPSTMNMDAQPTPQQ
jgi:hypothetical protein